MAYTFFKNNRIDQRYEVSAPDIKEKFRNWLEEKGPSWLRYAGTEMSIRMFIAEEQGLGSVMEDDQIDLVSAELEPVMEQYLDLSAE